MTQSITFDQLGLIEPLLQAVAHEGYLHPTPIQTQAIGHALKGRDIMGVAQTGTGKTAAFVLPICQQLEETRKKPRPHHTQALILSPTRELAQQIHQSVGKYSKHLPFRSALVTGGVRQHSQVEKMSKGVDILTATPGRLLDLVNQKYIKLGGTGFFVLDEADRMLDMGFIPDVRKIIGMLPGSRQTMLFSATLPDAVRRLASSLLDNPVTVEVSPPNSTADGVDHRIMLVDSKHKEALLGELLKKPDIMRALVFTRTKRTADQIGQYLEKINIRADVIHGDRNQSFRKKALENFRSGITRVLVATDVASRGLDIDDISHVINYELPDEPENYIHRIGRTARAGAQGIAWSFCDFFERATLRKIERLLKVPMKIMEDHPFRSTLAYKPGVHSDGTYKTTSTQGRRGLRRMHPRYHR